MNKIYKLYRLKTIKIVIHFGLICQLNVGINMIRNNILCFFMNSDVDFFYNLLNKIRIIEFKSVGSYPEKSGSDLVKLRVINH